MTLYSDKKFEKIFAKRVIERLQELRYLNRDFEKYWNEYHQYVKMIPSFGAIMFSKKFKKILTSKSITFSIPLLTLSLSFSLTHSHTLPPLSIRPDLLFLFPTNSFSKTPQNPAITSVL